MKSAAPNCDSPGPIDCAGRCLRHVAATVISVIWFVVPPVYAQTARTGGNANAELLQQMQQIASERTTLQTENERLKKELADVKKERDDLKAGQQAILRRVQDSALAVERSGAQRRTTDEELTQTKLKMQELVTKFRETLLIMRGIEGENADTKQALAAREREIKACTDRNAALYRLDDEVLTRLEKSGFWSRAAQAEPFTRLKRIQLENWSDEEKDRAAAQRVTADILKAAAAGTSAAPAKPGPATGTDPSKSAAGSPSSSQD
jgi:chromosome segregation ATPase